MTDAKKKVDPGRLMDGLVQLIQERNRLLKQKERMEEALRIVSQGRVKSDWLWWIESHQTAIRRFRAIADGALADAAAVEEG